MFTRTAPCFDPAEAVEEDMLAVLSAADVPSK